MIKGPRCSKHSPGQIVNEIGERAAGTNAGPIEQLPGVAHDAAWIDARRQSQFDIAAERDGDPASNEIVETQCRVKLEPQGGIGIRAHTGEDMNGDRAGAGHGGVVADDEGGVRRVEIQALDRAISELALKVIGGPDALDKVAPRGSAVVMLHWSGTRS